MPSINHPNQESPEPNETASRLRTVTGNRFLRKCSCGCGQAIPRDPVIRLVVDFGAPRPYPAYLREQSPDFGSYGRRAQTRREELVSMPGFVPATALLADQDEERVRSPPFGDDPAHTEADASPSPEAGRPWAPGQLIFNAGQFESARSGFADYAKEGETAAQLRTRVNRVILEDLEQKVLALRALHAKLRDLDAGASFGDVVARGRPRSDWECGD
ncbi:MAG: hypothetical protein ABSB90_03870 [Thermoplasmata archaeon]|jgi:hypothetical protein